MLQDVKANFSQSQDLSSAAGMTEYSTDWIDRADADFQSGEIAGDLGNGRPVIINLIIDRIVAKTGKTLSPSVQGNFKVYLFAGDSLTGSGSNQRVDLGDHPLDDSRKQEALMYEADGVQAAIASGDIDTVIFKVPPKTFYGRYLQLRFENNNNIIAKGVTAFVGRNTSDAQYYYPDRSSIR